MFSTGRAEITRGGRIRQKTSIPPFPVIRRLIGIWRARSVKTWESLRCADAPIFLAASKAAKTRSRLPENPGFTLGPARAVRTLSSMVAFAADYAPTTEASDGHGARQRVDGAPKACPEGGPNRVPSGRVGPQNRARGIFLAVEVRAGENGARSCHRRREKADTFTKTASGPTNFLNRYPIEEAGGLNLYAFVGNDPVNRWDYLGLDFIAVGSMGRLRGQAVVY